MPACPKTVLVVEDDTDILEVVTDVLEAHAYHIIGAVNGQDALDKLRRDLPLPCLILLDIMMPVMDGWQFLELQLKDPTLAGIPVVVVSAHADVEDAARNLTAAAFLKKPVPLKTLLATVQRFCGETTRS